MIYFPAKSFCRSAGERLSTDHHLTTYLSGLFRRIIFTLPHSFMLTATSAGICAHRTNSRAVSLHIAGCHSSPTRKAAGSNPVGRTKTLHSGSLCGPECSVVFSYSTVTQVYKSSNLIQFRVTLSYPRKLCHHFKDNCFSGYTYNITITH